MRIALLFSGGKDSTLALTKAADIVCLITLQSKNPESYMFHTPNINIAKLQAEALNLPLILQKTKGEKENELNDLKKALLQAKEKYNIDGVVSGAIRSTYQATRIQKICDELGLWCFNPLWLMKQEQVLKEVLENKIKAIISSVAGYPLSEWFLGKVIDEEIVTRFISMNINPAGEGGEFETTVIDAPFFKKKIEILDYSTFYKNFSGIFFIKKARLVKK